MVMTGSSLEQRVLPSRVRVTLNIDLDGRVTPPIFPLVGGIVNSPHELVLEYPDKEVHGVYPLDPLESGTGLKREEAALFFSGAKRVTLGIRDYIIEGEVARIADGKPVKDIIYRRMKDA